MNDEILGAIRQEASPIRMELRDIVDSVTKKEYPDQDPKLIQGFLKALEKSNKGRMIRAGNTVLAYVIKDPTSADFVLLNADPVPVAVRNVKQLAEAMKKTSFKRLSGTTTNPETAQILKASGISAQTSVIPRVSGKGAQPSLKIEMQL